MNVRRNDRRGWDYKPSSIYLVGTMLLIAYFESNKNMAASILFYEDFRVDNNTGNLHPGRYGYVTFQRWSNRFLERSAPNVLFCLANNKGVYVPTDTRHRFETDINVWNLEKDEETLSKEIFRKFKKFLNQRDNISF